MKSAHYWVLDKFISSLKSLFFNCVNVYMCVEIP